MKTIEADNFILSFKQKKIISRQMFSENEERG